MRGCAWHAPCARTVGETQTVPRATRRPSDALRRPRSSSGSGGRWGSLPTSFCATCRSSTALETTLATRLAMPAERLVGACDVFLVDFKIADRARSLEVTGIDPELRDENLARVMAAGGNVVARMPVIPGYTDGEACVLANARRAVELGIRRADILPFHQLGESKYASVGREYELGGVPQLSDEAAERIAELVRGVGLDAVVRGE